MADKGCSEKRLRFPSGDAGLTLFELFTLILVAAGFAVLLLPVFTRAAEDVSSVRCMDNLRRMGEAYARYASDYGEFIPVSIYEGANQRQGVNILHRQGYVEEPQTMLCPAWAPYSYEASESSQRYGMLRPAGWYSEQTHGFLRETVDGRGFEFYDKTDIKNPSDFILLADTTGSRRTQYLLWTAHVDGSNPHFRHGEACNFLAADGSVESASEERFVEAYRMGMVKGGSQRLFLSFGLEEIESKAVEGLRAAE